MRNCFTYLALTIFFCSSLGITTHAQNRRALLLNFRVDEDYLNYRGKGTDRYYTGGLDCSFFYKSKKKTSLPPLIHQKGKKIAVEFISLRQITNTPSNIRIPGHVQNDYPYASALFITYGKLHTDTLRKFILGSAISTGVIGPLALGEKIQRYFHRLVAYIQPEGWSSQLPNDFVLNHRLTYKKEILELNRQVELIATADINTGFNFNNCEVGLLIRIGNNLNYFSIDETAGFHTSRNRKGRFVFLIKPRLTAVAYNTLLQGSLLKKQKLNQRSDVYTISSSDISRVVYRLSFGFCYETKFGGISVNQHLQTKEFRQVESHEYGDIGLIFKFKK
jgi:lipid A 3-O-deacylase